MSADRVEDGRVAVDRTEILKAVVADAESMGLRDRDKIEWLTSRVIERLEQQNPLPGMEGLVTKVKRSKPRLPTGAEIQAMVEEILAEHGPAPTPPTPTKKEERPMAEPTVHVEPKADITNGVNLGDNARQVLEKRYLKKDKKGRVVETPEEMFRRVAQSIASAELIYDAKADVKAREGEFYRLMTELEFLPNSPTLMNAGREPVVGVFRAAGGGLDGVDIRCREEHGPDPQEWGRDRLLLFPAAPGAGPGRDNGWRSQRSGVFHARLRYGDGRDQTGGNAAGGEHGHSQRRTP
jgi:ribosomal protein S16